MKIPETFKKDNKTYIFVRKIHKDLYLYKRKRIGYYECFKIIDFIEKGQEKCTR